MIDLCDTNKAWRRITLAYCNAPHVFKHGCSTKTLMDWVGAYQDDPLNDFVFTRAKDFKKWLNIFVNKGWLIESKNQNNYNTYEIADMDALNKLIVEWTNEYIAGSENISTTRRAAN